MFNTLICLTYGIFNIKFASVYVYNIKLYCVNIFKMVPSLWNPCDN
jgi:hypothetical protein